MLSLEHLPLPPPPNKVTACENDGQLRALFPMEANEVSIQILGNSYVEIVVNQESARPANSKYDAKEAFSAHTETVSQRLFYAYHEEGLRAVLNQICTEEKEMPTIVRKFSDCLLHSFKMIDKLKYYLPFLHKSTSSLLDSSLLGSNSGLVVSIAWHPHSNTLAAVFADDTIRIYGKGRSLTPLLKNRLQKNITHIEWMPFYASILAVSCESGVLLWTLDPISVVTRPSGSCLNYLAHPSTLPTTSFSWHPKGLILACVGNLGRELHVWDVGTEESVCVHSGLASCFNYLNWSPDGSRLLAAMTSSAIKVFECRSWSFERWSLESPLQSAVWSNCGQHLLFVTIDEPFLYSLSFSEEKGQVGGSQVAIQVADLSGLVIQDQDGDDVSVGGQVKQLCWDSKGERLAVLFKDCELIALFHTYSKPQLNLAPGGFIRAESGRIPLHINFQNNVTLGSVLTITCSGGIVKHIPLRYTSRDPFNITVMNSSIRPLNQSIYNSPSNFNQSINASMHRGPTSPFTSPLTRLFTSPT